MNYSMFVQRMVNQGYKFHHKSTARRYTSRKENAAVEYDIYIGKFGSGFKVYRPRFDTTTYCFVEYWIKEEK